jgi:hypothetical protein
MEKNTKILIGVGLLAAAYYFYKKNKDSEVISSIDTKIPLDMPTSSISTSPIASVSTIPVSPVSTIPASPIATTVTPVTPIVTTPITVLPQTSPASPIAPDILAQIQAYEAKRKAAKDEIDRIAEMEAYEEENARQEVMRLANEKAYQKYLDELAAQDAANKAAEDKIIAARQKAIDEADDAEAARQKAMNAFMYCQEGFEWYQNQCTPSYIVQEIKVTEQANRGEGLILRDMYRNDPQITLVKTCPSEYVKEGINCIPRSSLSQQELQVIAMKEAGMVQTSDGQWYLDANSAAAAQAIINALKVKPIYSARQSSINEAICSVNRDGNINNPNSSTFGMSLSQYIGQFKVTAAELGIARASCPDSVYSSNLILGGRADDNALGYKGK